MTIAQIINGSNVVNPVVADATNGVRPGTLQVNVLDLIQKHLGVSEEVARELLLTQSKSLSRDKSKTPRMTKASATVAWLRNRFADIKSGKISRGQRIPDAVTLAPSHAKGSSEYEDCIKISGSEQFVWTVLGRLQDCLDHANVKATVSTLSEAEANAESAWVAAHDAWVKNGKKGDAPKLTVYKSQSKNGERYAVKIGYSL